MTDAAQQALSILRDKSLFQWYVIPIFVLVIHVYANEVRKRDWSMVLGGLAFWGMDWFNEIWNALIFHFTQYSAPWVAPGKTAYLILIGLNIEITLMFLVLGIACLKFLPEDKHLKIMGIPNRWFFALMNSLLCVAVEVVLNAAGALVWDYSWWNFPNVWLIIFAGYLPFHAMAIWVHDMDKVSKKILVVGTILGIDLTALLVFGAGLKWI